MFQVLSKVLYIAKSSLIPTTTLWDRDFIITPFLQMRKIKTQRY